MKADSRLPLLHSTAISMAAMTSGLSWGAMADCGNVRKGTSLPWSTHLTYDASDCGEGGFLVAQPAVELGRTRAGRQNQLF